MNKNEIAEKVITYISQKFDLPKAKLTLESTFESFGIGSLDEVEIIVDTEDEFKIRVPDNKLSTLNSVGLLVNYVDDSLNKKFKKNKKLKISML
jgi:acyl carrier protein